MITIVSIENVLARGEDLKTAQPTKQAKALYDGLRSQNNMVGFAKATEDIAQWWLKREYLTPWARVLSYPPTSVFTWDQWCVDQVRGILAEGWEVYAYVDKPGPVLLSVDLLGVMTLGVMYPQTSLGWKEVAPPRAWATVVDAQTP